MRDAEARFSPEAWWPAHPRDEVPPDVAATPATPLYFGGTGMVWALRYLRDAGAAKLHREHAYPDSDELIRRNRGWLQTLDIGESAAGSYLCGETPMLLMAYGYDPSEHLAHRLAMLIEGHLAPSGSGAHVGLAGHAARRALPARARRRRALGPAVSANSGAALVRARVV